MFFNKKIKLLKDIIEDTKELLPVDDYENAKSLAENSETLLALELVCEQLYEFDCKVPRSLFDKIEDAGKYYELDAKKLDLVSQLIID